MNILTWDAFGYYLYLPAIFIYDDVRKMNWVPEIVEKYETTGPVYQLSKELPNGNKAAKYLIGVSILYSPFFLMSHWIAGSIGYPQDGFSDPYQWGIVIAALFYSLMGLWVLRWVLLRYFTDFVSGVTLILIVAGTNYLQYVSVDSAMSHGFIFALYAFLLALTVLWYENPSTKLAFLLGCVIGLGIASRPTEIVMIIVPLLYNPRPLNGGQSKWSWVLAHKTHLLALMAGVGIAIFPQLLYWKVVTGSWIYDVGSKWVFFDPNWQVLFGWEKGWFIYTPIAFVMISGFLYLRNNPFFKAVLVFFILNTWIIIAWYDWRYGASYSTRALVQSYALMALPLAAVTQEFIATRWKFIVLPLLAFLILLNVFQVWQYNKGILHYDDMNPRYYQAIFLNTNPSPIQLSLLDTEDYPMNEKELLLRNEISIDSVYRIHLNHNSRVILMDTGIQNITGYNSQEEQWLRLKAEVFSTWGAYETDFSTELLYNGQSKITNCRMQNGMSKNMEWNRVEYYFAIPVDIPEGKLKVFVETRSAQDIYIKGFSLKLYARPE